MKDYTLELRSYKNGGLLKIHLQDEIIVLHESEQITMGLISSKSSKTRDSLVHFTKDFE